MKYKGTVFELSHRRDFVCSHLPFQLLANPNRPRSSSSHKFEVPLLYRFSHPYRDVTNLCIFNLLNKILDEVKWNGLRIIPDMILSILIKFLQGSLNQKDLFFCGDLGHSTT